MISYWLHKSILFSVGGDYTGVWIVGGGVIGTSWSLATAEALASEKWGSCLGSHFPAITLYVEGVIFYGQLVMLAIDLSPGVSEASLTTYVNWPQFCLLYNELVLSYYLETSSDIPVLASSPSKNHSWWSLVHWYRTDLNLREAQWREGHHQKRRGGSWTQGLGAQKHVR